nr:MAG TPA: hypothetical protein [Caudoviricetes sp.]
MTKFNKLIIFCNLCNIFVIIVLHLLIFVKFYTDKLSYKYIVPLFITMILFLFLNIKINTLQLILRRFYTFNM